MFESIIAELDSELNANSNLISAYKKANQLVNQALAEAFNNGADVVELVHARSDFVDQLLHRLWQSQLPNDIDASLIAVGGYGRGELHPASDVDVLILSRSNPEELADHLGPLITLFWDIGLDIGHSVRSLTQCVDEATNDITVATNLIESRLLAGQENLFDAMLELTNSSKMWPSDAFFSAKWQEQIDRHAKYDYSSANLEPNVKGSPGGLRDIQMIGWVAKRHFNANRLSQLVVHNFLTDFEYKQLKEGERYLWRVRFALHILTGRHEDRLLFEHQRSIAKQFGYNDENTNLAVEQFMQEYYRWVVEIQRLNDMLLQLFQEAILLKNTLNKPTKINNRFHLHNGYLAVIRKDIFFRKPLAMLELFNILQEHPEIKGVRASTIRALYANRNLIDETFRNTIQAKSMFMEIIRQPQGLTHALRRMHRYGILERYLPAFSKLTGLMQFDLYHQYTVDEHILMVIRNMRRFSIDKHADENPRCNSTYLLLPKPELLYLGGMFHDIAKGRGGDHSTLGQVDAREFCLSHQLSSYDAELVAWLVGAHLHMSHVAQQTDIDDPEVIQEFARFVGNKVRLNYLYLLTVADMRGTNPKRWNSWKGALLESLHRQTAIALDRGLSRPHEEDELIQDKQARAKQLLCVNEESDHQINLLWMGLSTEYFLQNSVEATVWHTKKMLNRSPDNRHFEVHLRDDTEHGCSEIFICGADQANLFARSTYLIDKLNLNIQRARIQTTPQSNSINSYYVLEADNSRINDDARKNEIRVFLEDALNANKDDIELSAQRTPRELKSFNAPSEVHFNQDSDKTVTELCLTSIDRPGMLATVGATFSNHNIRVHGAHIVTHGESATDRFIISDHSNFAITDEQRLQSLADDLCKALDTTH